MSSLFLSYARGDDEPFVQKIRDELTAYGFDVWRDCENMQTRGRTFLQELRDAVASKHRLILILGPKSVQSDYVQAHSVLWKKLKKMDSLTSKLNSNQNQEVRLWQVLHLRL
jgi:hypothetical protein